LIEYQVYKPRFSCDKMNDNKNILKINIFGTDYPLKINSDVEYVRRVAEYVDKKMREVQALKPNRPIHQIAILSALNITDELFQQKKIVRQKVVSFEGEITKLAEKLELGIAEDIQNSNNSDPQKSRVE
jgi:cell division protein ZapA